MNYKDYVYFDIETAGNYPDLRALCDNNTRACELFTQKCKNKHWEGDPYDIYIQKAGLLPEFGKIICVSIATIKQDDTMKMVSYYSDNELDILRNVQKIFNTVSTKTLLGLCGFFIKGFDIPWLNRKMLKYDMEIPKILKTFNVKPWEMNVLDLSELWKNSGSLENVSFDEMLYSLDIDSPKNEMSGKDVHNNYWNFNNLDKIKDYCENDVKACIEAAKKICPLL